MIAIGAVSWGRLRRRRRKLCSAASMKPPRSTVFEFPSHFAVGKPDELVRVKMFYVDARTSAQSFLYWQLLTRRHICDPRFYPLWDCVPRILNSGMRMLKRIIGFDFIC
jgi:hypothetical protein